MTGTFSIAGGSVAGRHHARAGRNNQDAFAWRRGEAGLVAAVCDGCSSGAHSEVGARLGAALLVEALSRELEAGAEVDPLAATERAQRALLERLEALVAALGTGPEARRAAVGEHFLFTVVGFAVGSERAWAFAAGDGVLAVDGAVQRLGPFPGNAPPYLGYALLPEAGRPVGLEVRPLPPPADLRSLLVGTDGAAELDLAPLLADPRVPRNPDMARRLLWAQARERGLDDDATAVVLRRREGEGTP